MSDEPRRDPVPPGEQHADNTPTELSGSTPAPQRLGPYRLLQKLGEGGMGEVWFAEQEQPVRRRVALKVIKRGMDTRQVIARFEAERQALAMMDHPAIAKVFDAGETPGGRPYFVMEHVPGVPINEHCDRQRLSTRERLELFLRVCEGVQHAHQKAIIHRDLKPTNVLVAVQDGRPVPKIIDFGVAKATAQRLTERTMYTELGIMIGTPEYMSPEQAEMTGQNVDTRTDVYSLGVILYELLVGALPFESKALRQAGVDEVRRRIREVDPPRPSTRISTLGDASTQSARRRRAEPRTLARQLKGDLDWITMKALEKEPARRYGSVAELAADIERYLNKQPVLAGPPGAAYRVRKFTQRHKAGVIAAALVLVALLLGIFGTTAGLVRALRAERSASREAETSRQVSDFLVELFEISDPEVAQGESVTAREILDQGARRIEVQLQDQPATQARLMNTIGTVYRKLGLYDEAAPLLEQSLALRERLLGARHLDVAETLNDLARLADARGSYRQAESLASRSLEIREAALGPDHPDVARSTTSLGWALAQQGRYAEAKPLFERALAIREAALPPDDPDVADSLDDLGILFWRQGDYDEAEPLLERALSIYERSLGPDDARVRTTLNDLAVLNWSRGRFAQAEEFFQRALAINERVLGPDHPGLAGTLNNLAVLFDTQGRYAEAQALAERALGIYEQALGPVSDNVGMAVANLAWFHYRQGRYAEAEPLYRRARSIYEQTIGPEHSSMATLLRDHALLYKATGQYREAERALRRALAIREKVFGPDHPDVAEGLQALADLYVVEKKTAEAEPLYRRALEIRERKLDPGHPALRETLEAYASLLRRAGRDADAEALEARGHADGS